MSRCTDACPKLRVGARAEHCMLCHQTFTNTAAGDRHRTGRHGVTDGPDRRRCRTADEMLTAGLRLNNRGCWTIDRDTDWLQFDE